MAKDIWEQLVAFVKKLVDKIMDFFKYIGHFISKMLRNITILFHRVKTVKKDDKPIINTNEVDFTHYCKSFNVENANELVVKVANVLSNSVNVTHALRKVQDAVTTFYRVALTANDVLGLMRETTDNSIDYRLFKLDVIERNSDYTVIGEFIKGKQLKLYNNTYKIEIIDGPKVEVKEPMLAVTKDVDLAEYLKQASILAGEIEKNVQHSERSKDGFKNLTDTIVKAATKIANRSTTTQENKEAARVFKNMAHTTVAVTSNLLQLVTENLVESVRFIEFYNQKLEEAQR